MYRYTSKWQRTASSSTLSLYSNEGSEWNSPTTYSHPGGSIESIADSGIFIGHSYKPKAPYRLGHPPSTNSAAAASQSNLSQYSKDDNESERNLEGEVPGNPHLADPRRRYPALSLVGNVSSSYTVNRPMTGSHRNLTQHL